MFCAFVIALVTFSAPAFAQTKSLKLYYIHTGEKAEITYKKNGQFLASGLKKINWHLRDWRRNEPTKMDPELLDLVWEAYRQSGSRGYITVISGYRSPASNNLLRSRGRGVAKNSQHTLGKALDFYLPDVKLSKLREIGLKLGVGGVGYYPTSGSPFVHFDTGSVRHWPRMSRSELARVFPKGDTMHVPTDGKPLARYQQAVAEYKRKKANGTLIPNAKGGKSGGGGNLFALFTARNNSDDEEEADSSSATPAPRAVTTKAPAPVAAEEPKVEEPQFASLPKRVPVPMIAPRGALAQSGTEIVIASADPVEEPQPQDTANADPVLARDETTSGEEATDAALTDGEETPETAETALASLIIPVPERRPELETPASTEPERATSALAMVDPNPPAESRGTIVAALTPAEIEDLRSRVRSTIGATVTPTKAPVPAAKVADSGETAKPAEIRTASLAPVEPPVAIEPVRAEVAPTETAIADEVEKTGTELPVAETEAETVEEAAPAAIVLASLPVPVQSPIRGQVSAPKSAEAEVKPVQVASLETAKPATAPTQKKQPAPELVKRTISLDRYSAPEENSATIGQFALKATTTIRDLSDVRAPAYGRNVIREVPKVILVQGFNLQPFGPGKNNFSGKAVSAMKYTRQSLNSGS